MKKFRIAAMCASAVVAIGSAIAQPAGPVSAGPEADKTVFTRARFASSYHDAGKFYVRLKLLPRSKIPFMTHDFQSHGSIADGRRF